MNPYGLTNNYSLNGQRHQHYSPNHFKLPYFQSTFRQAGKFNLIFFVLLNF